VQQEFIVKTVANDDAGRMVRAYFDIPAGVAVEYQEQNPDHPDYGEWFPLEGVFGPSTGFPVMNVDDSRFRATFDTAGDYSITIEFKEVGTDEVLATYVMNVTAVVETIAAEVDYTAVWNGDRGTWYIKVTVPGEDLDNGSVESIKAIKEAGAELSEPRELTPDTDKVMWFGVAKADGELTLKEAGEYAYEVVRKDGTKYIFSFTYTPGNVQGVGEVDTKAPELVEVSPDAGDIHLAYDETFKLEVTASDKNLYELEVDHSFDGTLPEFSVYASEEDPYGGQGAAFAAQGVEVTYNADEQKWTIDFGPTVTQTIVNNGGITFYLVLVDEAGNKWGSMDPTTQENTFDYIVTQTEPKPVAFHATESDINGIYFVLFEIYRETPESEPEPRDIPDITASDFTLIKDYGTEQESTIEGIRFYSDQVDGYIVLPPVNQTFEEGSYRLIFNKTGYRPEYIDVVISTPRDITVQSSNQTNIVDAYYKGLNSTFSFGGNDLLDKTVTIKAELYGAEDQLLATSVYKDVNSLLNSWKNQQPTGKLLAAAFVVSGNVEEVWETTWTDGNPGKDNVPTKVVMTVIDDIGQTHTAEEDNIQPSMMGTIGSTWEDLFPSDDASITGITVDGEAATVDAEDATVYHVELPFGTNLGELTASAIVVTPTDANATVAVATTADGGATWTVVVTAEDGVATETYTIHVTVAESAPEDLGYTFDASTKTITGYTGNETELVIPSSFKANGEDVPVLEELDITLIDSIIQEAIYSKEGVVVSNDGTDLPAGTYWVTQADMDALDAAIAKAEAAKGTVEIQQDIAAIVAELEAAVAIFNDAKQEAMDEEEIGASEEGEEPVQGEELADDEESVEDEEAVEGEEQEE
jgi:hypothetical protein